MGIALRKLLQLAYLFLILLIFCVSSTIIAFADFAHAQIQTAGPISLSLPPGWSCDGKEGNFICLDQTPSSQKNSAIVISYKKRTAGDSLLIYRDQLGRPRTLYQGDLAVPSQPKGTSDRLINGITWIEGIHLGSEMPLYYTHYYATVAGDSAILVSYSMERTSYQANLKLLYPTINSMRLNVMQTNTDLNYTPETKNNLTVRSFLSGEPLYIMGYKITRNMAIMGATMLLVLIILIIA